MATNNGCVAAWQHVLQNVARLLLLLYLPPQYHVLPVPHSKHFETWCGCLSCLQYCMACLSLCRWDLLKRAPKELTDHIIARAQNSIIDDENIRQQYRECRAWQRYACVAAASILPCMGNPCKPSAFARYNCCEAPHYIPIFLPSDGIVSYSAR